jgi:DNA-binding NtrC family response regulator
MSGTQKETILIIDDDKVVRQGLSFFLEDFGYHILTAENGRVGVDLFERQEVDLVLVDLRMPEMGGLEVLDRITQNSPYTPLIVLTGATMISDAIDAMKHGAWDYLVKPINDSSQLTDAIENGLSKARLKKEQFLKKVQEALDGIKMLKGIIPMCSFCKKIRDTDNNWEDIDVYIVKNSQAIVSHSLCPACAKKHYPEIF